MFVCVSGLENSHFFFRHLLIPTVIGGRRSSETATIITVFSGEMFHAVASQKNQKRLNSFNLQSKMIKSENTERVKKN